MRVQLNNKVYEVLTACSMGIITISSGDYFYLPKNLTNVVMKPTAQDYTEPIQVILSDEDARKVLHNLLVQGYEDVTFMAKASFLTTDKKDPDLQAKLNMLKAVYWKDAPL